MAALTGQRRRHAVVSPADESVLGRHCRWPASTALDAAAESARRGFALWRKRSALQRCDTLRRAAGFDARTGPMIATVLTLEQGKPTAETTTRGDAIGRHHRLPGREGQAGWLRPHF
ncbi:MAG: aldehyde dehydrogenase family protein [Ideonella sp.]|nr:aldehyde dehydrogenase family protein [Ideonella sp.]